MFFEIDEKLELLKQKNEAPQWLTSNGLKTFQKRLNAGETPKDSFARVAKYFGELSGRKDLVDDLFDCLWSRYICLATPVHTNFGGTKGLPISCFKTDMADNLTGTSGIFPTNDECAEMSRVGGGVGVYLGNIRSKNTPIKGTSGVSGGVVPWMRLLDTTFDVVSQANRRGSGSVTLDIDHPDWDEFIECRDNTGDPRRRVYDLHLSTNIKDSFMFDVLAQKEEAFLKWKKLLQYRWETGESYIEWYDTINRSRPQAYVDTNKYVKNTNICTEILQYIDAYHSVVCCLSSLNLAAYSFWKSNSDRIIELIHRLLDAVITDFLNRAPKYPFLKKAVEGAKKARAIGIGVLGWHDLLIQNNLPYDNSFEVMNLNREIFQKIDSVSLETSKKLATEYGEPEWLKGYGERNMFRTAVAPTKSNSAAACVIGEGIAPITAHLYEKEGAEGKVYQLNPHFVALLDKYGQNNPKVLKSIARNKGSVQQLDFLTEHEKKVFLTAREIDQHKLIRQCAQRQAWIDQGQSINLWFPENASESYVNSVHLTAWQLGVKTLYYLKSGPAISGDVLDTTCEMCEG